MTKKKIDTKILNSVNFNTKFGVIVRDALRMKKKKFVRMNNISAKNNLKSFKYVHHLKP